MTGTEDTTATAEDDAPGQWAVYDTTLERFVGGVHTKRPTKKAAEAMAPGHTVEVRTL